MCQSLQDTQFGSIANYNSILSTELQKVQRDRQSRHPHVPEADVQNDNGPQDTLSINPPPQALISPVPRDLEIINQKLQLRRTSVVWDASGTVSLVAHFVKKDLIGCTIGVTS